MIREYGIDPGCVNSEAMFFKMRSLFGLEHLRVIRRFPENWESLVRQSLKDEKPVARKRVIEHLIKFKSTLVSCSFCDDGFRFKYENEKKWLNNAEEYHKYNPFHGIISKNNPMPIDYIRKLEELDSEDPFLCTDNNVRRSPSEMARAIRPILLQAKVIHFVDPYFADLRPRRIRPLIEFIKIIFSRNSEDFPSIERVIYHTADTSSTKINTGSDDFLSEKLAGKIAKYIPIGKSIEIIRWPAEEMHNRYILTNIGGVAFQIGLDDDDENPDKEIDTISPITPTQCLQIKGRKQSCEPYMSSNKTPSITINGMRK